MTTTTLTKDEAKTNTAATAAPKTHAHYATPAVDLYESRDAFVLSADVPGAAPENVDLQLEGERLSLEVKAEYPAKPGLRPNPVHVVYRRQFTLGRGLSREDIHATLRDGLLTVRLPKTPEKQPRRIQVEH